MPSKPMQRSLKHLKDNGWTVAIVEKWKHFPGMKFGVRQDVWGFGDILACRNWIEPKLERTQIALIQTTDHTSIAKHRAKILGIPEFEKWKAAGGLVLLHGWAKRGPRGKRKVWTLKEEML
jgi:hypothetical protein